jgi:hypothetical protein
LNAFEGVKLCNAAQSFASENIDYVAGATPTVKEIKTHGTKETCDMKLD